MSTLAERLDALRQKIGEAARQAGRVPEEVRIVGVSKRQPSELIRKAYDAGLRDFGENYVQEALGKQSELADLRELRWHLIGHLQTNKAGQVAGRFALIQSAGSERLARRLGALAESGGSVQDILLQVQLGQEESKSGVDAEEAPSLAQTILQIPGIRLLGLMGIAPLEASGEKARPYFAKLRALFEQLPESNRQILSMGMSGDYQAAVEEGATLVRIGTALFGARAPGN